VPFTPFSGSTVIPGNQTVTGQLTVSGTSFLSDIKMFGRLFASEAGTPATSNLGTNVTSVTPAGNDVRGNLTVVIAAGGLAANTRAATVTFSLSYGAAAPVVSLVNMSSGAGLVNVNPYILAQSTGVSFDLAFDQALAVGTYIINYIVIG
jgi:hypothetical protein